MAVFCLGCQDALCMAVFCMGWKELVFSRPPPLSIPPPGWAAYVHLMLGPVHGWQAKGQAEEHHPLRAA